MPSANAYLNDPRLFAKLQTAHRRRVDAHRRADRAEFLNMATVQRRRSIAALHHTEDDGVATTQKVVHNDPVKAAAAAAAWFLSRSKTEDQRKFSQHAKHEEAAKERKKRRRALQLLRKEKDCTIIVGAVASFRTAARLEQRKRNEQRVDAQRLQELHESKIELQKKLQWHRHELNKLQPARNKKNTVEVLLQPPSTFGSEAAGADGSGPSQRPLLHGSVIGRPAPGLDSPGPASWTFGQPQLKTKATSRSLERLRRSIPREWKP
jgi:hypothetical protein